MSRHHLQRKKPVIGLAGGVGSGKSTVARMLESLGAAVIDSDRLAHEQLADPEVTATLRSWWGQTVCTPGGDADRGRIATIVFNDPEELSRLERLIYPGIARRRAALMAAYEADPHVRAVVIDAAKLFEAGVEAVCDVVIFVEADRNTRVERVARARRWNEEELNRREKHQIPLDIKRANADHVVVNHADLEALRSEVERVFTSVLDSFAGGRVKRTPPIR